MSHPVGAKEYPNNIFKQTTLDEEQALSDQPRFCTWTKGWLTRSEIYERMLPDGLSSALRIDGPSDSAFSLDDKGNVRILTGKKTQVAGSGVLGIKTWGQQQLHNERSNIQYCAGGTENEGQALNILAYGDVVEQAIGGTRYIKASKIEITATEELVLNGQTIKIQAQGDIEMGAAAINTVQTNKKEIVLWGNGKAKREVIHVDDVAEACVFFMNKNTKDALINIGTGKDFSIKEYSKKILKCIYPDKKVLIKFDR